MYSIFLNELTIVLIQTTVYIYDIFTWPIYQLIYKPWQVRKKHTRIRAAPIVSSATEIIYEAPKKHSIIHDEFTSSNISTMAEAWKWCVNKYETRSLLGTRQVIGETNTVQANGKTFKKLKLGDYKWLSYGEANINVQKLGRGLRFLGQEPHKNIAIFADTRAEWWITAQACFLNTFPLVTVYTNLGEDAITYALNHTQVSYIITSHDLLPKFRNILKHTPHVNMLIYFEDQLAITDTLGFRSDVKIIAFRDVLKLGQNLERKLTPCLPKPEDAAIIMFTSGSTGVPKGVILSHRNIVSALKSLMFGLYLEIKPNDSYLAFLPLAHILELIGESTMCTFGIRIGYSTPNTLTDKSTMVHAGSKGDATSLRPTVILAVPLIYDRIYKSIYEAVNKRGALFSRFFAFCYTYRLTALKKGENTPIIDKLIFRNIRALLGSNLRLLVSGGAPLSPETHECMQVCLGVPLQQGYGLTETSACATICEFDDINVGTVGPPHSDMQIKLVDWVEGGYSIKDKPKPRGEIVVGGGSVAEGYYLMPEKTSKDFYNESGRRWFRTGDIGQIEANGSLTIIDRKKDLVKLQFGEYVSLGKVESCLKTCPIVDNICIYCHSSKTYIVALVVPNPAALENIAIKLGIDGKQSKELCSNADIIQTVLKELSQYGKKLKLEKFEIPRAVTLVNDVWLPDTGMVTAAFKLKRKPIQDCYQKDIDRMYGDCRSG